MISKLDILKPAKAILIVLAIYLVTISHALAAEEILSFMSHIYVHEDSSMTVTELRSQAKSIEKISERENIERKLQDQVHKLIAVAENYPELKANQNFLELQKDISDVENDIQYARRYYNGAVRIINTRIDSFPDLLVAKLFNYKYHEYFQLDD